MEDFTKEDEFKLADINAEEYTDCNKDVIAAPDIIQTISNLISQYESKDDIDEVPEDIMPSSAESIVSLKTLRP